VIGYLQDLNEALFGYPLSISPETFKKILLTEDPLSPQQVDFLVERLRINKKARRLPHTLIVEYFGAVSPWVREKIRLVWQSLKEPLALSDLEKAAVMKHLARKLQECGSEHQPAEIEQIIFWEVLSDDDTSGAIYEYFLSQSEHLSIRLLRRLYKYAPDGYKEQFEAVLKPVKEESECWTTELSKSATASPAH